MQAQTYQVLIWGPATALATSQAQGSSVSSVHESEPSSNAFAPSTSSSRKPDDSEQNPWTTEGDQVLADLARKEQSICDVKGLETDWESNRRANDLPK